MKSLKRHFETMNEQILVTEALLKAQQTGTPAALVTIIQTTGSIPRHEGSKMLVYPDGAIVGTIGGGQMESKVIVDAQKAMQDGAPLRVHYSLSDLGEGDPGICGGTAYFFIEPLTQSPTLLVVGGGHVGKALCELGKFVGFRVVLSDDRPGFCDEAYIPGLDGYLPISPDKITRQMEITPQTYVACVTRGLPVDKVLIPALLETDAAYIGLIGSRRRWALTVKSLQEEGISTERLERVHSPLGLELNAETPQEIAVSIMAEVLMLYRGGDGKPMKWFGNINNI